jgi:hypothetical protein
LKSVQAEVTTRKNKKKDKKKERRQNANLNSIDTEILELVQVTNICYDLLKEDQGVERSREYN